MQVAFGSTWAVINIVLEVLARADWIAAGPEWGSPKAGNKAGRNEMAWHRYLLLCIVQGAKRKEGNLSSLIQLIRSACSGEPFSSPRQRWTCTGNHHDTRYHPRKVYLINLITIVCFSGIVYIWLNLYHVWTWAQSALQARAGSAGSTCTGIMAEARHISEGQSLKTFRYWKTKDQLLAPLGFTQWELLKLPFRFYSQFKHHNDLLSLVQVSASWSPTCIIERKLLL